MNARLVRAGALGALAAMLAGGGVARAEDVVAEKVRRGRAELAKAREALAAGQKKLGELGARVGSLEGGRKALESRVKAERLPEGAAAGVIGRCEETGKLIKTAQDPHLAKAKEIADSLQECIVYVGGKLTVIEGLLRTRTIPDLLKAGKIAKELEEYRDYMKKAGERAVLEGQAAEALLDRAEAKLREAEKAFQALQDKYKTSAGLDLADATLLYMETLASMLTPAPKPESAIGYSAPL